MIMPQLFTQDAMIRFTPPTVGKGSHQGWGFPRAGHRHAGLDFPCAKGSPVFAAAAGTAIQVKNSSGGGTGKMISLDHGDGIVSRYMHNTTNTITMGQKVRRGEKIGTCGTTGTYSSGPHVHFDTKLSDTALAEYKRRYGSPTSPRAGYGKQSTGRGVPSETFMDGAKYTQKVIDKGIERKIVFFKPSPVTSSFLFKAALAVGAGLLVARYMR